MVVDWTTIFVQKFTTSITAAAAQLYLIKNDIVLYLRTQFAYKIHVNPFIYCVLSFDNSFGQSFFFNKEGSSKNVYILIHMCIKWPGISLNSKGNL